MTTIGWNPSGFSDALARSQETRDQRTRESVAEWRSRLPEETAKMRAATNEDLLALYDSTPRPTMFDTQELVDLRSDWIRAIRAEILSRMSAKQGGGGRWSSLRSGTLWRGSGAERSSPLTICTRRGTTI